MREATTEESAQEQTDQAPAAKRGRKPKQAAVLPNPVLPADTAAKVEDKPGDQTEQKAAAKPEPKPEKPIKAEMTQPAKKAKQEKAFEVRSVKRQFTDGERSMMGMELARAVGEISVIQAELETVKATFKARTTAQEGRIEELRLDMINGFKMESLKLQVIFDAKAGKKRFYREEDDPAAVPFVLEEPMQGPDYVQELNYADKGRLDSLKSIELFKPAGADRGEIVIGTAGKRWYAAVRAKVGAHKIEERLDGLSPSTKHRFDSVRLAAERFQNWLVATFNKDTAKGFEEQLKRAVESQKEIAE